MSSFILRILSKFVGEEDSKMIRKIKVREDVSIDPGFYLLGSKTCLSKIADSSISPQSVVSQDLRFPKQSPPLSLP
jgi:hypothetical protein